MRRRVGCFRHPGLHGSSQVAASQARVAQRRTCPRVLARIIATATALVLGQPVFGAAPNLQYTSSPTDLSSWLQPISFAIDDWSPSDNATGSCDATRSRTTIAGPETFTLTASGTPCGDTRSLGLTLKNGHLSLFANVSATEAATLLSNNFRIALQYGITDTLTVGFREVAGVETNLLNLPSTVSMPAATSVFGPIPLPLDTALTQFSVEYSSGSWLARTAVLTGSPFTLQEIEVQNRIAPNWTADVVIEHAVTGVDAFDAGQFAISGRIGDVSVGLNYTRGGVIDAFEPDGATVPAFAQGPDTRSLSVSLPCWGWQWTLAAVGGSSGGFTLTAQRSSITVTLSGEPLGVWLAQNSQF